MARVRSENLSRFLTDSFVILLISLYGYALVYLYEYGYCSFFNIPSDLIIVSLFGLLKSALYFVSFISLSVMVCDLASVLVRKGPVSRAIAVILGFISFPSVWTILIIWAFDYKWHQILILVLGYYAVLLLVLWRRRIRKRIKQRKRTEGDSQGEEFFLEKRFIRHFNGFQAEIKWLRKDRSHARYGTLSTCFGT